MNKQLRSVQQTDRDMRYAVYSSTRDSSDCTAPRLETLSHLLGRRC